MFSLSAPDLGPLSHVVVTKEGGGLAGDWHLQMVEVMHPGEQETRPLMQTGHEPWRDCSMSRRQLSYATLQAGLLCTQAPAACMLAVNASPPAT